MLWDLISVGRDMLAECIKQKPKLLHHLGPPGPETDGSIVENPIISNNLSGIMHVVDLICRPQPLSGSIVLSWFFL
jgi:hypothetical protein